ncbi:9005_t:CDS:2 [Acaulospora colombiana]|uniref:9005_t:CDS:1 n=1 Tax=Acaulospora colombiana TaxID=27376 RepID=A0ACA9NUB2_9GLOM|nr:9005_t:CDS:2 [Acaulospora colombiana]
MYLHRRYFLEALVRRSQEPLRSKYALSVLSVHRSAVLLLQGIRQMDEIVKGVLPRLTFMWAHALWVCLCAIVIKSPGCVLAQSSLAEIDKPTIITLFEQAHHAMDRYREGNWPSTGARDELATDVMKLIGRSDFALTGENTERTTHVPGSHRRILLPSDAHPSLFEYIKQFESQSDRNSDTPSTDSIQASAPSFTVDSTIPSSVAPTATGYTEPFGSHLLNEPLQSNSSGFESHTNRPNYAGPSPNPPDWSSSFFYDNQMSAMNNHQGNNANVTSSYPSYDGPYLVQGVDYAHLDGQPPQDQVWEQFLSILIPSDTNPDATSIL